MDRQHVQKSPAPEALEPCVHVSRRAKQQDRWTVGIGVPTPHSLALAPKRPEVPYHNGVSGEGEPDRLAIAVAYRRPRDYPYRSPPEEPPQRKPSREVEAHNKIGRGQWYVPPRAVRRVEHPLALGTDSGNSRTLHVQWDLHPARLPGEVVDGVPRQPHAFANALREHGFTRACDAVHQDPRRAFRCWPHGVTLSIPFTTVRHRHVASSY